MLCTWGLLELSSFYTQEPRHHWRHTDLGCLCCYPTPWWSPDWTAAKSHVWVHDLATAGICVNIYDPELPPEVFQAMPFKLHWRNWNPRAMMNQHYLSLWPWKIWPCTSLASAVGEVVLPHLREMIPMTQALTKLVPVLTRGTGEMTLMVWSQKNWLCLPPERGHSRRGPNWPTQLPSRHIQCFELVTSIPFMTCWNSGRDRTYETKASESPWLDAIAGYLKGISVRV